MNRRRRAGASNTALRGTTHQTMRHCPRHMRQRHATRREMLRACTQSNNKRRRASHAPMTVVSTRTATCRADATPTPCQHRPHACHLASDDKAVIATSHPARLRRRRWRRRDGDIPSAVGRRRRSFPDESLSRLPRCQQKCYLAAPPVPHTPAPPQPYSQHACVLHPTLPAPIIPGRQCSHARRRRWQRNAGVA